MSQTTKRATIISLLALVFAVSTATSPLAQDSPATDDHLTVHEWGTFTSIAGSEGEAVKWRPLDGASDLPSFVCSFAGLTANAGLRHGKQVGKGNMEAYVRMETPVLYFYTDRETTVSVRVDFPQGRITEWYPHARLVVPTVLDWGRVKIIPGAEADFPVEQNESHYYAARATDAAPVRVCGNLQEQTEKFLFYRGVGSFEVPLAATLEGNSITLKNTGRKKIARLVVFENRGGKIGYQIHAGLKREAVIERPALNGSRERLQEDLKTILIGRGLYDREAQAMIDTWRDSWFEEGMRVFYIFPRSTTDATLPLNIAPAPAELVRVMVGRAEIITPEMEREMEQVIASLASSKAAIRNAAMERLQKRGRFAAPILKRILNRTKDERSRALISSLIANHS